MSANDEDKQWRLIAPQHELSGQPCRRLYCNKGKAHDVALYCIRSQFYAIDATCPHMGGPLDVIIDIEQLMRMEEPHAMCPWHLYAYNLKTGIGMEGLNVQTHETKIENGNLFVLYKHELSLQSYNLDKKSSSKSGGA